jgi:hypothetical protein
MVSSSSSRNGRKNGVQKDRSSQYHKSSISSIQDDASGSTTIHTDSIPDTFSDHHLFQNPLSASKKLIQVDYSSLTGTEPWLLDNDDLWKGYAMHITKRILETGNMGLFPYSAKIQHDFNDKEKIKNLEERLFTEETCGKNFENMDFVGNIVDMSKKRKLIVDVKDLSEDDISYLMNKYKSKYNLKDPSSLRKVGLDEKDLNHLNESLMEEAKKFTLFYATMMRVMHSLHTRKNGRLYENHPLESFDFLFIDYEDKDFFDLPANAHTIFKNLDKSINEKLEYIEDNGITIKGDIVLGLKRPDKKLCFESVIYTLMHDVIEEVADDLIKNYDPKKGWSYEEWKNYCDIQYQQKVMGILYGTMAEAYWFVKNNSEISHKHFFYKSIKSITESVSKLTKDRFDSYVGYAYNQLLHPQLSKDHLQYPFNLKIKHPKSNDPLPDDPKNKDVKEGVITYHYIPKVNGAPEMKTFFGEALNNVMCLDIPLFKQYKDIRGGIRTKTSEQHANSIDVAHFQLSKAVISIFKAKTFNELALEFYSNKKSKQKKEFFYEVLKGAAIQNDLNLHALYGATVKYMDSIFESKEYKNNSEFKKSIDSCLDRVNQTIMEYIKSENFPDLTKTKKDPKSEEHPWPDGWHIHMIARITTKEYDFAKRILENGYSENGSDTYLKNIVTNLEDAVMLFALSRYKQQLIRQLGIIPKFGGHSYNILSKNVGDYLAECKACT